MGQTNLQEFQSGSGGSGGWGNEGGGGGHWSNRPRRFCVSSGEVTDLSDVFEWAIDIEPKGNGRNVTVQDLSLAMCRFEVEIEVEEEEDF